MKKKRIGSLVGAAVAAVLAFGAPAAFADELTERAKGMLAGGNGPEAFRLLDPVEGDRAGDVEYDLLLGQAALAVGQNTRAVFALERVLAMDPSHVVARAEIARAYLKLGETKTALQEFETVKRQGVPADVSMTIDRYIAEARRVEDMGATSLRGYVEATLGHDTNVNFGPGKSLMVIPGISNQPLRLGSDTTSNDDTFAAVAGGLNLRAPIGNGYALLAGLSGSLRGNFSRQEFDTQNADVNLGVTRTADKNVYTLMAQAGMVYVDKSRYRNHAGLTAQWQRNLDARNQVGAFVQYTDLQYASQERRDANRWVAGASYAHLYRDGVVAFASAYYAGERPRDASAAWLGFDGVGLRIGGRMNYDAQTILFGAATWEYRDYRKTDALFLNSRRDNQYGLTLGATRYLTKEWSVTPQLLLTVNDSNTRLNDYHREALSVTVRREF